MVAFSSTPPTAASEGSPYSYQLAATDSAGGSVTFSLAAAPTGAALNGSTVSWTPTSAQSRVSNSFTVSATTGAGGSATQSWTVTPTGTVRISWVDNYWDESGSTAVPFNWSPIAPLVAVLVPQPDGSFQTLTGSAVNGVLNIPNVPAGYFWLEISSREIYWTSSSTFDMGHDYSVNMVTSTPTTSTTTIDFQLTGLDPTTDSGWVQVLLPGGPLLPFESSTSPGSTVGAVGAMINGNVDYSAYKDAFMMQYEPAAFGPVNGFVLGPELSVTDLSLTSGAVNTISEALSPKVPASMPVAIKASEWVPLFDRIAPSAPSATGGVFAASLQLYSPHQIVTGAPNINLIWSPAPGKQGPAFSPSCGSSSSLTGAPALPPALSSDFDAGEVQYSDPFPSNWLRSFTVMQCAAVSLALPGGSSSQTFILTNTQSTPLPTSAIAPLISPVQNPKINGADLFTASTINSTAVTLSWSAPAVGTPTGYEVQIATPMTTPTGSSIYSTLTTLSTKQTSVTVPPSLLAANKTYVFLVTAVIDGQADVETSPHHSALPVANADVISGPITIGGAQ